MQHQHPSKEELFQVYLKETIGTDGREVHRHLQSCVECRQVILDYERIDEIYRAAKLEEAPSSAVSFLQKRAGEAQPAKKRELLWTFVRMRHAAALLVVFVAAGLGIFFYDQYLPKQQTPGEAPAPSVSVPPPRATLKSTAPPTELAAPEVPFMPAFEETARDDLEAVDYTTSPSPMSRSLVDLPRGDIFDPMFQMAEEMTLKENYPEAEHLYRTIWAARKSYHQREKLLFNWAFSLEKMGRAEDAAERIRLLDKINPDYPGLAEAKTRLNIR